MSGTPLLAEGGAMITVENLTKRYGGFTAVDDISFQVRPGSVVGFLGPNGAGKSTAMRMMTGLTPATSGHATILGQPYRELHNPGRQVGVMLDASAQHPGRTGREVLRVAAVSVGVSKTRVEEVLALVGLTDEEAGRRVRNYSLGMRQRLGIAAALLGEPQVLILDEPANGLDPQGIHWMRGLLRRFADGGGTVLLSSHLLHEVQIVADDLVMIGRGRIVAMGSKEELLSRGGTTVQSTDDARLATLLERAEVAVTRTGSGLVVDAEPRVVGTIAAEERVVLLELRTGGSEGLEEMFLGLTAATSREGDAA
jgi:ABC-2 type transport system ATP-binding protein